MNPASCLELNWRVSSRMSVYSHHFFFRYHWFSASQAFRISTPFTTNRQTRSTTVTSSHPNLKNGIPYSQFLRLRRLCSEEDDFFADRSCPFRNRGKLQIRTFACGPNFEDCFEHSWINNFVILNDRPCDAAYTC